MSKAFPLGRICWNELTTTDTKAAKKFYKAVVGWGTQAGEQDSSYAMWTTGDTPVGGLMALPEDAKQMTPNWLMYVAVPDVDESVRHAVDLGARTDVEPQDIPQMGRFAVLSDPQGATFGVFTATGEIPGHDGQPKLGEFSWHELVTNDSRAASGFYEQLFGWEKFDPMDMGPLGIYQIFGRAGVMLGGMYDKPVEMSMPPHWLCYALVANADKAAGVVERLGGKVLNGPMDVPNGGRIAQCVDPQGAAFAVHADESQAKAKPKAKRNAKKAAKKAKKAVKKATKAAKKMAKKAAKAAKKEAKKAAKAAKKEAKKGTKAARKAAKKAAKTAKKAKKKK